LFIYSIWTNEKCIAKERERKRKKAFFNKKQLETAITTATTAI